MSKRARIAAALVASAGLVAAQSAHAARHPITLLGELDGNLLRLSVVANASEPLRARFVLHVDMGTGNRSRQAGRTALKAGETATLAALALTAPRGGDWTARLEVQPEGGGEPYVEELDAGTCCNEASRPSGAQ